MHHASQTCRNKLKVEFAFVYIAFGNSPDDETVISTGPEILAVVVSVAQNYAMTERTASP
jgi:hypothetical protein